MLEDGLRDVKNRDIEFVDSLTHIDSVEVWNYWVGDPDDKEDLENNVVGAKYLNMDNSFQDYFIFTVELPMSEHKLPEDIEAKLKEVQNLEDYEVFQEIVDDGPESIGSHWVITQKEKHEGQKTEYKASFVARGFQETLKAMQ